MLVKAIVPTEQVVDVICDVCGDSTTKTMAQEYGTLSAHWGMARYGTMARDTKCISVKIVSLRRSRLCVKAIARRICLRTIMCQPTLIVLVGWNDG